MRSINFDSLKQAPKPVQAAPHGGQPAPANPSVPAQPGVPPAGVVAPPPVAK